MLQEKLDGAKRKVKRTVYGIKLGVRDAVAWGKQNPEFVAVVVVPVAVAAVKGTTGVAKKLVQHWNNEQLDKQIKRRCYDPSEGHYWYLSRELSNQEWLRVNKRHESGERIGDILAQMNVLK